MARRRRQAPPPPRHPPTTTQASNRNNTTTNRSQQWTPQRLLSSSYQDLGSPQDVAMNFQNCLLNSPQTLTSLLSILLNEPGKTGIFDYSLQVDIHDFISMDPVLGNMLLRHPAALISVLEEAIVNAQREILKRWNDFQDLAKLAIPTPTSTSTSTSVPGLKGGSAISSYLPVVKGEGGTRVHARLVHLPPHFTNCKPSLASLTSHDVGKILQLSGTVVRTSRIQMYESQRAFQCSEKKGCGTRFTIKADLTQWNNALTVPSRCPNPSCKCKIFNILPQGGCRSDYQEIKVQESMSNMSNGTGGMGSGGASTIPRTLLIKLQHDLVDKCQPGDDVVVVGTLLSHWQNLVNLGDIQIGMVMQAHSIRVANGGDGSGGGSSWDCIFNGNHELDDDEEEDVNGGKRGMVREEIVKEYQDFWKDDFNKKKPIAARNFICKAVCPTLYGLSLVKLALLLVLIGGSSDTFETRNDSKNESIEEQGIETSPTENHDNDGGNDENDLPVQFSLGDDASSQPVRQEQNSGSKSNRSSNKRRRQAVENDTVNTRRREQSHLLLVGDPGCGKSQFLRFATALCPRSVLASGSGTTSAGLTCAAVREDSSKEWTLEAGALVLADRGVCAIDEFSCINPKDRTTIHEAMEQQTLSVAKAGIVCKLNCRATVIAVTNAKAGYYDHDKSFTSNVGIEPPLLSRFDLIFKLIDGSDANKDDNIATFLLNRAIQGAGYDCTKKLSALGRRDIWGIDKLRAYVATVKSNFRPAISHDASILMERHYSACRASTNMSVQITVRFLESLIRLAQAHASLMHRNTVELDDAVAIILLMESSVASISHNDNNSLCGDPTSSFPDDDIADLEFLQWKVQVLKKYDMEQCITPTEWTIIDNEQKNSAYDPNLESWEQFENGNQNTMTSPPQSQTMDHYGRLTQKATPSPSKMPRHEFNTNFTDAAPYNMHNPQQPDFLNTVNHKSTRNEKRPKSNHTAD